METTDGKPGYVEVCHQCGKIHHLSKNAKKYKEKPTLNLSEGFSFLKGSGASKQLESTFKPQNGNVGAKQGLSGVEQRTKSMLSPWMREMHAKVKENESHWIGLKPNGHESSEVHHVFVEPEKKGVNRVTHAGDTQLTGLKKSTKPKSDFVTQANQQREVRQGGLLTQGHIDSLKQVFSPTSTQFRPEEHTAITHQATAHLLHSGAIHAGMTAEEAHGKLQEHLDKGVAQNKIAQNAADARMENFKGWVKNTMATGVQPKGEASDTPKSVDTPEQGSQAQSGSNGEVHKRHLIQEGQGSSHQGGKYDSEGEGQEKSEQGKAKWEGVTPDKEQSHSEQVKQALKEGKEVPANILKEEKQKDKESRDAARQHLKERETERTEPLIMGKESGGVKRVGEQERNTGEKADFSDKTATHTYGNETTISAAGDVGNKQKGKYAVVEADDLIPSQTDSLSDNPRYDPSLQPKDRTRQASEVQIEKIARELDFHQLGAAPSSADGAPIIGKDNMVESGNARTLAIRRAIKAHPESYAQYKQDLTDRAGEFGINSEQLKTIKNPVLVRVREGEMSPQERSQWADIAGKSPISAMSSSETAKNDGKFLTDSGILSKINPDSDLDATTNKDFVTAFLGHLSVNEQNDLVQANGDLSSNGLRRVNDAILSAAYDDPEIISQFTESRDINIKNLGNAMRDVAPKFALIKGEIAKGNLHEMDISTDVAQAAKTLSYLRKKNSTVEQHLAQQGAFGKELTETGETLLRTFEQYRRSGARVAEILNTYTEAVFGAGNPKQGSMFEEEAPRPLAALMASIAHVEEQHADQSRHQPEASSLFA